MPVGASIRFNQRSTYIWPTKVGYLLLAIFLLMMIGSTNYQNNLAFLLTFLLVGIGLVCIVFTFRNLQGIEFALSANEETYAGQPISLWLSLRSYSGREHYSIGVGTNYDNLLFVNVPVTGYSKVKLDVGVAQRGWYPVPRLLASSQFPFGWMRTWAYFGLDKSILVYPQPLEPVLSSRTSGEDDNEEGNKSKGVDDLYGLKPYQEGEPLSRVDWKAYARERGMFVREFTDYQSRQLCFCWDDFPGEEVEKRLSYLTYMVTEAANQQLSYSMKLPNQYFEFDDGEEHCKKCLKALALYGKQQDDKKG